MQKQKFIYDNIIQEYNKLIEQQNICCKYGEEYEIYAEKRRSPVSLSELPDNIKWATISIEDKDFYKHRGLSYSGIIRALYKTVIKRDVQGGSTISQQLVKNALLTNERTIRRKAQELILTLII